MTIPRVDRAALAAHIAAETPCVIVGGARAAHPWTVPYLDALVGDLPIRCKLSATHVHPNFRAATLGEMFATEATTFRDLFASFTGPDRARRLFTGDEQFVVRVRDGITTVHEPFRPLLADVEIPDEARAGLYTIWAWFSGAGVHTGLHYDNNGCHNLNAQLAGNKRCVLYPPSELARMKLFVPGGSNPAVNCSAIDLEREPRPDGGCEATLEAGDLLFIPAWWFHAFWHLGDFNANMNFWFKPAVATPNPVAERQRDLEAK
jgi:hypothetical protein